MKKKIFATFLTSFFVLGLLLVPQLADAQTNADPLGLGEFQKGAPNTFGERDIRQTIAQIINVFMGLLGTVAVVIILIGGFKWMTAGGNDEKVGEAKKLLLSGVVGLAIILAAFSITRFVVDSLVYATR